MCPPRTPAGSPDNQEKLISEAQPRELDLPVAETVTSARLSTVESGLDRAVVDSVVIVGTVDDAYFYFITDGPVAVRTIDELVRAQVDRIVHR